MPCTFTHDAMATAFQIAVAGEEPAYARQAATEAFAELDRIEARLSRFAEGGDIWRINRLRAGEATFVHHDTLECLRVAEQVRRDTAGAFDIAYASAVPCHPGRSKAKPRALSSPGTPEERCLDELGMTQDEPFLALDEESHTVRVLAEGVRLDLGGIGKGFALDRMAALLREWETASALLCASTSTLLALDPPPSEAGWAAELGPADAPQRLLLANQALSASGLAVKGSHIIDPRTGRPAERRLRAWAIAPTAALADALSTAFMVMSDEEVRSYCRGHAEAVACVLSADGKVVS